jgi:hypothetical protein
MGEEIGVSYAFGGEGGWGGGIERGVDGEAGAMEVLVLGGRGVQGERGAGVSGAEDGVGECLGVLGVVRGGWIHGSVCSGAEQEGGVARVAGEDGEGVVGLAGEARDQLLAGETGEEEDGFALLGLAQTVEVGAEVAQDFLVGAVLGVLGEAAADADAFGEEAFAFQTDIGEGDGLPIGVDEELLEGEGVEREVVGGGEGGVAGSDDGGEEVGAEAARAVAEFGAGAEGGGEKAEAGGGGGGEWSAGGGGEVGGEGAEVVGEHRNGEGGVRRER